MFTDISGEKKIKASQDEESTDRLLKPLNQQNLD